LIKIEIETKTNLEELKQLLKVMDEKTKELNEKIDEVSKVSEKLKDFKPTVEIDT